MNPELPKNVREALAKQAAAGTHPAADLLNAYAERALTSQEDVLVAGHLSACATCREVVFLANSAAEAPESAVLPVERAPVTWWRWAVPVSALVAIAVAFFALNPLRTREAAPVVQEAKALPQEKTTDNFDSRIASQPSRKSEALPSAGNEHTRTSKHLDASKKSLEKLEARDKAVSRPLTQMATGRISPPPPPAVPSLANGNGLAGAISNSPTNVQTLNAGRGGPSQQNNQIAVQNASRTGQGVGASSTSSDTVEVTGGTAALRMAGPTMAPTAAKSAQMAPALPPSALTAKSTPAMSYVGGAPAEADASAKPHHNAISRMAADIWRITPDGHLERLMQNQWHRALNGVQTAFHVVASVENHVWAGGKGPELFHSADGGENWDKIEVKTADGTLNGTMRSIRADDAQHVAIVTDSGETWTTSNGGQTWAKQQ